MLLPTLASKLVFTVLVLLAYSITSAVSLPLPCSPTKTVGRDIAHPPGRRSYKAQKNHYCKSALLRGVFSRGALHRRGIVGVGTPTIDKGNWERTEEGEGKE
ncbi:hypothetical protein BKA70DRAFT_1229329 [Coprinopsis sp. MPI-PUGE-AT-0042]|nr:hypothetical protein BKA70DRAFT_1229329 [Coprinopsis sp. MPI-PUGE-AT-0042]